MPTLTIPNVLPSTLAYLTARAARANRTVEEEALALIEEKLVGPEMVVVVRPGGERLPAPLAVEETRAE